MDKNISTVLKSSKYHVTEHNTLENKFDVSKSNEEEKPAPYLQTIRINTKLWKYTSEDLSKSSTVNVLEKFERISGFVHGLQDHTYGKSAFSKIAFDIN